MSDRLTIREELEVFAGKLERSLEFPAEYTVNRLEVICLWLRDLEGCVEEEIGRLLAPQQQPAHDRTDPRSEAPAAVDVEQEPYGPVDLLTWVCDEQYEWIRERYGDDAANHANYGWGTDAPTPTEAGVATKVYGHGILSTAARVGAAFEVTHEFTAFGSEADLASKRRAMELMRQRFDAGFFDEDPPGAPPGGKQRVREWLEERERELGEAPAQ